MSDRALHHPPPRRYRAKSSDPRDDKQRIAYETWIASLSPEEKARLRKESPELLEYMPAGTKANGTGFDKDVSETPACRTYDEPEPENDNEDERSCATTLDVLRKIVGELLARSNSRLSLECLALATGLSYRGNSQTEIGDRHGVSRAAVSARCVDLCNALGIDPSRAMKSKRARESYRKTRFNVIKKEESQ